MSRPLQINEEDCTTTILTLSLPPSPPHFGAPSPDTSPLEISASIAKIQGRTRRASRGSHLKPESTQAIIAQLESITKALPEPLHPSSSQSLDPRLLSLAAAISNTHITLHRQSLAPETSLAERTTSLSSCISAARMTTRAISRTLRHTAFSGLSQSHAEPTAPSLSWESHIRDHASALLCTHIWRCILLFSFALDFESALTCARVSVAIGSLREVNTACGKYTLFFLEKLKDRTSSGRVQRPQLETDEEMLAYVSADLQGDPQSSWIWDDEDVYSPPSITRETELAQSGVGGVSEEETPDESIWDRVVVLIWELIRSHGSQPPQPHHTSQSSQFMSPQASQQTHRLPPLRAHQQYSSGPSSVVAGSSTRSSIHLPSSSSYPQTPVATAPPPSSTSSSFPQTPATAATPASAMSRPTAPGSTAIFGLDPVPPFATSASPTATTQPQHERISIASMIESGPSSSGGSETGGGTDMPRYSERGDAG